MKKAGYKYAMRGACGLWPNRSELVVLKSTKTEERIYTPTTSYARTVYTCGDGIEWAMINGKYYALRRAWRHNARTGKELVYVIDYQHTPLKPYKE